MQRRTLLAGAAAGFLAAPHVRAADAVRVLRFVPNVDLPVLDPIANTAAQVRNHAFLIWDTLYGLDEAYAPQPQMVEGHRIEQDGRDWTLTLRPGLKFHDNTPVLARDVEASIRRWATVDGFGMTLMAVTDALSAPDDRTIRFRLKRPFPLLPAALGKMSPNIAAIMPARLAALSPNRPVPELIGSGPFRFVPGERVPGAKLVYERFDGYVPRPDGKPGFTSGPKVVNVDRVEWQILPEPATAASALRQGEVDWVEVPTPDLLPILRQDRNILVEVNDKTGVLPVLRFNCLHPPFDQRAIRRAVLESVEQADFMTAYSDDPALWHVKAGAFCPGTPMASEAGLETLFGKRDLAAGKRAIVAAGYKGERVVMMGPTDHPVNSVMAQVGADLMKRLGLNVDYQAMDAGTMFQRRTKREGVDEGGWSVFPSAVAGIDVLDPAVSFLARGNGKDAWYGWPTDAELERLRLSWFEAPDLASQQQIAAQIQLESLADAPFVPLGQIIQPSARRRNVTGVLPGFAKFWNIRKD